MGINEVFIGTFLIVAGFVVLWLCLNYLKWVFTYTGKDFFTWLGGK